jgi:hypothetical protein
MPEEFRDGNYGFGNPTTPADKDTTEAQLSNLSSVEETAYGSDVGFYETNHAPPSGSVQSIPQDDVRYRQEHEPYNYQPDGDQFVYITKAHLYEIHPLTSDLIKRHELSPLKIKLDSAKGCVYTQFMTDQQGKVLGDYILLKTEEDDPPESTPFGLLDEDGSVETDKYGIYNILLFKFANGQILRNHYSTDEEGAADPRSVQHYGGVEGHRGPLIWSCGYNTLNNLGVGEGLIYKDYTVSNDKKNLRSLKQQGQINIATAGDQINIRGNSYDKTWQAVPASGVTYTNTTLATFADGLLTGIPEDLEVVNVPTAASGSTTVNSVDSAPTINTTVETLTTTQITPPSGTGMSLSTKTYTVRELSRETLEQQAGAWKGGAASQSAGLSLYEVHSNIWVMGKASTGGSPPTFPTFITGASTYTGVKNLSSASVDLYQAHSSGNHKYLESTDGNTTTNNIYVSSATTPRTFITSTGTPIYVYSENDSTTSKFFKTDISDGTTVPIVTAVNTTASTFQTVSGNAQVLKAP